LSWYRIWSDGWIEQGDRNTSSMNSTVTKTLLVPMTQTNYFIIVTETDDTSVSENSRNTTINWSKNTTTTFTAYINRHALWYVMGY
jgi:intein-encoded DNA endonuclease-like protein